MYFSNLHDNVVYSTWYPGPYTLFGDVLTVGAPASHKRMVSVCAGDLDICPGNLGLMQFKTLVIEDSVCAVKEGFIEAFTGLRDLIVEADRRGPNAWTH